MDNRRTLKEPTNYFIKVAMNQKNYILYIHEDDHYINVIYTDWTRIYMFLLYFTVIKFCI